MLPAEMSCQPRPALAGSRQPQASSGLSQRGSKIPKSPDQHASIDRAAPPLGCAGGRLSGQGASHSPKTPTRQQGPTLPTKKRSSLRGILPMWLLQPMRITSSSAASPCCSAPLTRRTGCCTGRSISLAARPRGIPLPRPHTQLILFFCERTSCDCGREKKLQKKEKN